MPTGNQPSRVPYNTHKELKDRYDELILYIQNAEGEIKFFKSIKRWTKFLIVSHIAIMILGIILIFIFLFK